MKKTFVVIIAVVLLAGTGGFFAGMQYDKSKNTNADLSASALANMTQEQRQTFFQERQQTGAGTGQRGSIRASGNFAAGEIIAKDDKSITIKLQDGGSKIVFLSDTTPVTKSAEGALTDLTIGQQVTASGTTNQDGSITAQNIQIRPAQTPPPAPNNQQQ
ncbi:MAG: hypothetical protein V1668_01895 [Patescibacteria group bacterium]